ncbi:MAG: aminoacyl-tRNA hydrolase [Candidatus Polarisedimenticolaceae bacterium]|nr:aminoacyl-tRNA hydrolase [Candidatus Polarisedimenticolaceae bacterium]
MLKISNHITIPESELEFSAIRAQGAGGQHVNKVSSAIHLRFDVKASSLPASYKQALLKMQDQRLTKEGVIIIKSQQYRSQEMNREQACLRLKEMILCAIKRPKKRVATKPTRGSQQRRMDSKTKHGRNKALRKKIF